MICAHTKTIRCDRNTSATESFFGVVDGSEANWWDVGMSSTLFSKGIPMSALLASPLAFAASIVTQVDPVTPSKDFPGAQLMTNLLQWGMYLSLALSVGSIIYGAGSWTWSKWGNSGYAVSGKSWVLGGVIGALLSGLAVTIVNNLFTAAGK